MKILVTGGAGYIGSFASHRLIEAGHQVVVYDNYSTGFRESLHPNCKFVFGDVRDRELPARVMKDNQIDSVLHFAAKTIVPESIKMPLEYFENNFFGGLNLLQCSLRAGVKNFLFSSSAAVYASTESGVVSEESPCGPINPYGTTKWHMEKLLEDVRLAHGINYIALRYFNVAGAALDGKLGQRSTEATHLIKVAAELAAGKRKLIDVYGDQYKTKDGTAIRDFIHVEDLVAAHVLALDFMQNQSCGEIFNCGYGKGSSVLEVLSVMEKVSGQSLEQRIVPPRAGDQACVIADSTKIKKALGWRPSYDSLETICKTSYDWEKSLS